MKKSISKLVMMSFIMFTKDILPYFLLASHLILDQQDVMLSGNSIHSCQDNRYFQFLNTNK